MLNKSEIRYEHVTTRSVLVRHRGKVPFELFVGKPTWLIKTPKHTHEFSNFFEAHDVLEKTPMAVLGSKAPWYVVSDHYNFRFDTEDQAKAFVEKALSYKMIKG